MQFLRVAFVLALALALASSFMALAQPPLPPPPALSPPAPNPGHGPAPEPQPEPESPTSLSPTPEESPTPVPTPSPLCPSNCTNHGTCTAKGVCVCDDGWSGAACEWSAPALHSPFLSFLLFHFSQRKHPKRILAQIGHNYFDSRFKPYSE